MKRNLTLITTLVLMLAASVQAIAADEAVSAPEATKPSPVVQSEQSRLSVLLYFGLYTQWYRLDKALEGVPGHKLRVSNARTCPNGADFLPTPEDFPAFDVIILSDVNYDSLGDAGVALIAAFVKQGGGLLVLGGPFAYGEGDYGNTILQAVLPVETIGSFDLKWEKEGLPFSPTIRHPILEGVAFSPSPYVYWIHEARPNGDVILKAGDRPLLVVGDYGRGKVAAFLGSPLGLPRHGELAFWDWSEWEKLMCNTVKWLVGTP